MPLTIDATVGGASATSYSDVAGADAVASYRIGGAAWLALTSDQKIQALVTATRQIDALEQTIGFKGARATDTQALEWPRTGTAYADDELPTALVSATIELAFSYVPAFTTGASIDVLNPATNGNIKSKKVDVLETEYFAPTTIDVLDLTSALAPFPPIVQRYLAALVRIAAVSGWGSAEAIRTS